MPIEEQPLFDISTEDITAIGHEHGLVPEDQIVGFDDENELVIGGGIKLKKFFTWLIWIILFVALVLFLWWFVISPWIWQNSDKFETFSQSKVIR